MTYSIMRMTTHGSQWPSWSSWHISEVAVVVAALGIAGLLAVWPRVTAHQKYLFSLGLLASVLLLSSDVQWLSMASYPSHMIEHIVVVLVIAPLFAGATRIQLSRAESTLGFFAFTVLIPLFHLTPLGSWVMRYPEGHIVELAIFLIVGVWFWIPVFGLNRKLSDQQRITYAVMALPVIATTGLVLWSSTSTSLASVGMNMSNITIADVHTGGLVMMVLGTAIMLGHVSVLSIRAAALHRAQRLPAGLKYA